MYLSNLKIKIIYDYLGIHATVMEYDLIISSCYLKNKIYGNLKNKKNTLAI